MGLNVRPRSSSRWGDRQPRRSPITPATRTNTMSWLDPLSKALDETSSTVPFFFRDDDAGWEDARLFELIDVFADHQVPVDLAVIPKSISRPTAARLRRLVEAGSKTIAVHQHGYAHLNHEREGRKNEFGPGRSWREQLDDIKTGQALLLDLLGPITDL